MPSQFNGERKAILTNGAETTIDFKQKNEPQPHT